MSRQVEASAATPLVGAPARDVVSHAQDLVGRAASVAEAEESSREAVRSAFGALRSEMVRRDLASIPVERLKDSTAGRLRLAPLAGAGYRTVLDVLDASPSALLAIPGVGNQTANQIHGAARQVATAVEEGLRIRVDLDPGNQLSTALLIALRRHDEVHRAAGVVRAHAQTIAEAALADVRAATAATGRVRWLFSGREKKTNATIAMNRLAALLQWADEHQVVRLLDRVSAAAAASPAAEDVWRDFERRSAEYYGLLGEVVDLGTDVAAAEGYLPAEIVARVQDQQLDESFRNVSLRGYQSFGARFALVQRRVILGDEMGLGKTIQAIAAMAHLRARGGSHFLVVCPASVIINWLREVHSRSRLTAYRVHGAERADNLRRWLSRGGVAVTTYETLRSVSVPADHRVAMLVVDEAHYVKNPRARRSTEVRRMSEQCERTLFLTGTPMENRVEEFRNLVGYLQPHLLGDAATQHAIAGPDAFRKAVAPVYLRRNQEDVLAELPELVQVEEWEEFGRADFVAYRSAVAASNFMAMRRAAFASEDPQDSAKLRRLVEIVDEAGENGHRVIVFSYFRDVLGIIAKVLGRRAFGPLTGDVPASRRQQLVDAFSDGPGGSVLVSQIQAGGVGLNLQAGSVVILCEPQVKPTLEAQAIGRAHRMGQVRTVKVHRLLIEDSVDQRMLEILDSKSRMFDEYARRSDIASLSPDAVDVSEVALAREVVAKEQERLALELAEEFASTQNE